MLKADGKMGGVVDSDYTRLLTMAYLKMTLV
jgi:hypothetical protein